MTNVAFCDPRDSPMASDHSVDLVTTFDCMHDMTHPQEMMESIRSALADDGTWLLVDIKALDTFEQNVRKNPMASLMYGVSVLSCMSSALSEPGGAGLGTLGLSANKSPDRWPNEQGSRASASSTSTTRSTRSTRFARSGCPIGQPRSMTSRRRSTNSHAPPWRTYWSWYVASIVPGLAALALLESFVHRDPPGCRAVRLRRLRTPSAVQTAAPIPSRRGCVGTPRQSQHVR